MLFSKSFRAFHSKFTKTHRFLSSEASKPPRINEHDKLKAGVKAIEEGAVGTSAAHTRNRGRNAIIGSIVGGTAFSIYLLGISKLKKDELDEVIRREGNTVKPKYE